MEAKPALPESGIQTQETAEQRAALRAKAKAKPLIGWLNATEPRSGKFPDEGHFRANVAKGTGVQLKYTPPDRPRGPHEQVKCYYVPVNWKNFELLQQVHTDWSKWLQRLAEASSGALGNTLPVAFRDFLRGASLSDREVVAGDLDLPMSRVLVQLGYTETRALLVALMVEFEEVEGRYTEQSTGFGRLRAGLITITPTISTMQFLLKECWDGERPDLMTDDLQGCEAFRPVKLKGMKKVDWLALLMGLFVGYYPVGEIPQTASAEEFVRCKQIVDALRFAKTAADAAKEIERRTEKANRDPWDESDEESPKPKPKKRTKKRARSPSPVERDDSGLNSEDDYPFDSSSEGEDDDLVLSEDEGGDPLTPEVTPSMQRSMDAMKQQQVDGSGMAYLCAAAAMAQHESGFRAPAEEPELDC